MNAMWKWFAKTDDGFEPVEFGAIEDAEDETDSPGALPAHVQEFLALKAAAGF